MPELSSVVIVTASRLSLAREAIRPALKARVMIAGPAGAGKTFTALTIGSVLAADGKLLVIDTENDSALTYAGEFTFQHLRWAPPYDPRELAKVITEAGHEFAATIVDSTSHFWRKQGGTLDIASGKFSGWKTARPAQEDFVEAVLQAQGHVLLCVRSKMAYTQEEGDNGKQTVRKLGMAPQQDDDLEYELNVALELDIEHRITVSKSRSTALPVGRMFAPGHGDEAARLYADWLAGGEPPAPVKDVAALKERLNALDGAARGEFKKSFGHPDQLAASRFDAASAFVASLESAPSTAGASDGTPDPVAAVEGQEARPAPDLPASTETDRLPV